MRKVRSLLSVLLVCCLLVNVVPVKSKAVGATAAVVGVSAAMVAASALIGLGVSPGEDSSVFTGIVQNLVDGLETAGYVAANGLINVFFGNSYGISQNLLNFIHDWVFSSKVVSELPYIPPVDTIPNYDTFSSLMNSASIYYDYALVVYCEVWGWTICMSDEPWDFYETDNYYVLRSKSGLKDINFRRGNNASGQTSSLDWSKGTVLNYSEFGSCNKNSSSLSISSDYDISLHSVSSSDLINGYPSWAINSITISAEEAGEDEDIIVYPIGLGPDYDTTISKPQEDVWAGTSEYEIEAEGDSEAGTGTETGLLSSILSAVKSIPSAFEGWFKDLIDLAGEIGEAIIGLPARIKEALTSLFQDVVNVGQAVVDAVLGIPQAIADVLTAIFVPDQAYVEAKVDAVYAQFPFIQSIIATGEELKGAVSGSSGPPVIYVDLGLAPSGDFGSQKVLLTDFSWYEPYKQRVDTLLSAALWALFGWRMYLRLPSIISGEGGIMIASERAYRKLGDD